LSYRGRRTDYKRRSGVRQGTALAEASRRAIMGPWPNLPPARRQPKPASSDGVQHKLPSCCWPPSPSDCGWHSRPADCSARRMRSDMPSAIASTCAPSTSASEPCRFAPAARACTSERSSQDCSSSSGAEEDRGSIPRAPSP